MSRLVFANLYKQRFDTFTPFVNSQITSHSLCPPFLSFIIQGKGIKFSYLWKKVLKIFSFSFLQSNKPKNLIGCGGERQQISQFLRNKKQSKHFTKIVKVLAVRYGISPAPPSSEDSLLHLCAVFLDLVRPIRCEIKNIRFTLFNSICTAVLRAYI